MDDNKESFEFENAQIELKKDDITTALNELNRENENMDYCEHQIKSTLHMLYNTWQHDNEISSLIIAAQESLALAYNSRHDSYDEIKYKMNKDLDNLENQQKIIIDNNKDIVRKDNYE